MAMLDLKQIKVLLKRNYLLHVRNKLQTAQMVGLPILLVMLLVMLKFITKPKQVTGMPNLDTAPLYSFLKNDSHVYIAPNFTEAAQLTKRLEAMLPNITISMFPDLAAMDQAYKDSPVEPVGIYFPNASSITEYALRYTYGSVPSSSPFDFSIDDCRSVSISFNNFCSANQYLHSGFASMQASVDTAIIQGLNSNLSSLNVDVQRMPKPGGIPNADLIALTSSFYLTLTMLPVVIYLLGYVVVEKQAKINEAMEIMGLNSITLRLSWLVTYGVIVLGLALIISVIAAFGQLFPQTSFFLVFLLFLFYGICIVMFGLMLATFFTNAEMATVAGSFLVVLLGLLYLIVAFVPNLNVGAVWALNLFAPTGFATAISKIALLEIAADGANFGNIWDGDRPIGITLVMLPVDIVLYFLLTLYFDNIIPDAYGQRKQFYFFLMPSYWNITKHSEGVSVAAYANSDTVVIDGDSESISEDFIGKEAIRFQKITKVYGKGSMCTGTTPPTTVVNNFSLDVYEGQITALLGHNGAGKTTLLNILSGFVDATSGQATVFDYQVSNSKHMSKIRQMTGFCPQHNILFDVLSVREHLNVFAGIKGIDKALAESEVERVIKLIGLEDQAATFAKKLSGGEKRKLCFGIAIIGDPKVLILDEPTAGMDPYSRQVLWDVLRARKEGRVTLLTTHFMDEADILADRKAILSRGQLRCVGSSLFLKNRFGIGYHLGVITKTAEDHNALTEYVATNIPGSERQRATGYEVGFTLPIAEVGHFADLFEGLEKKGDEINVQSFGISMTTLEDVFLKIGEEDEVEKEEQDRGKSLFKSNNEIVNRLKSKSLIETRSKGVDGDDINLVEDASASFNPVIKKIGKPKPGEVFFALFQKQLLVYRRYIGALVFGLVVPLALAITGAAALRLFSTGNNQADPPLISVTGGAHAMYEPFLYKNSTGGSLNRFVSNSPAQQNEQSNLTNLFFERQQFSYLAADIKDFGEEKLSYKALYNTSAVHSLPTIVNIMSQSFLGSINSTASPITTYNKRWPARTIQPTFNGGASGGVLMMAFAVMMVTGLAIVLPVIERELKIRSQLRVSGIQFKLYWLPALLADFSWYLIVLIGYFIGIAAFNVGPLLVPGAIGAQILLFVGSGLATIMATYCAAFLFKKYETAFSVWFTLLQLILIIPHLIVLLVDFLNTDIAVIINVIFLLLIPHYSAFSGLYYITKVYNNRALLGLTTAIPASVYFDWSEPMVPLSILMAYIHIVVFFVLLQILDVVTNGGKISDVFCKMSKIEVSTSDASMLEDEIEIEDDDVREERRRVNEFVTGSGEREPVMVIQNLRKEFVKRSEKRDYLKKTEKQKIKVAVDNLSLSVCPGEVLGLLGPNGAGKTTVINVLTADHAPTRGKVFISGKNVQSNSFSTFQQMGYCSQEDSLWSLLTLKEHLEIYATIHGVEKKSIKATIHNYVDALDIREHLDKPTQQLSGGTKRKLCFIIAMLGNPQVVLLDEPSTGMDMSAKQSMWKIISTAFEGTNRGAILTTHYMDEADSLCSRVAIMVSGKLRSILVWQLICSQIKYGSSPFLLPERFLVARKLPRDDNVYCLMLFGTMDQHHRCLGSTQHLKGKFGQGYVLEIKMQNQLEEDDPTLTDLVQRIFSNVGKPEQFSHRYVYKVAQSDVESLSKVFSVMEEAKERLGIEEYSFSQSTLEQVFLQFAKEQDEHQVEEENEI